MERHMGRREIFAGNWKMHKTYEDAVQTVESLMNSADEIGYRQVVVFPPATYVRVLSSICKDSFIDIGIQNIHFEEKGAFTGEVSAEMAHDCGARFVLVGHSERRHTFGETDDETNLKVKAALSQELEVMLCVGELLEEREAGETEAVISRQLDKGLEGVSVDELHKIVIAYEPVWAIGTGKVATPEIAEDVHRFIRKKIENHYGAEEAEALSILYGGSVKPDNIEGLYAKDNIDGVLVGGASLQSESFLKIIQV